MPQIFLTGIKETYKSEAKQIEDQFQAEGVFKCAVRMTDEIKKLSEYTEIVKTIALKPIFLTMIWDSIDGFHQLKC